MSETLKTILKSGICTAALSFCSLPALGEPSDAPVLRGALYPADIVAPITVAEAETPQASVQATQSPVSTIPAELDPDLVSALGPAAYILQANAGRSGFQAQIQKAIGQHPSFHAQAAALDESSAGRKRARSALYPQLSSQFRGDYVLTRDFDPNTDNVVESLRPREQFTAGLSASQLIFDGGATFQRIKSARARHSEFQNALSTRINDLAFEALSAYHDLLTHQALAALSDAIVRRHQSILEDVKERERLGAGSRADVTRANARLAAARARASEIRESAGLAEIRYADFFKEPPGALSRPSIIALAVDSRAEAVAAAMQHNPELDVVAARATASTAEYKAAKGERLPEVRVSVDAVKYDVFNGGDDYDVRAGLDVQYNIFSGGLRSANIAEAGSRARQARFNEEQVRQEIARDAAFAFERSHGAGARLDALKDAVIAHDQTRELVLERYRVSRGDLIDVLQAENDYFEAAVAYVTGLANRDLATYALMEHTGDLIRFFSPQNADYMTPLERSHD